MKETGIKLEEHKDCGKSNSVSALTTYRHNRKIGILCVCAATFFYGIMPMISQLAYKAGLSTYSLLIGRFIVTFIIFAVMLKISGVSFKISKKQFFYIQGMGLLGVVSYIATYASYHYLPGGIASLVCTMYIIFVVLLEFVLKISPKSTVKIIGLITAFCGVILIMWTPENGTGISSYGVFIGLIGALTYSIHIFLIDRPIVKSMPLKLIFIYEMMTYLCILPIVALWFGENVLPLGMTQWKFCIILALLCSVIAMLAFYTAVRLIGAGNASLIGTAEPLVAAVAGAVVMKDVLTGRSIIGGLLILVSIFFITYMENKKMEKTL